MNLNNIKNIDDLLYYNKLSKINYKIYLDLDGTIVNMPKAIEELGYGSLEDMADDALWDLIKHKTKHFWLNLEWMPDGKELWNYIKKYNPIILSSPAPAFADPDCIEDKKKWVKREIGDVEVIITTKKHKYAEPNSILIDDMTKNINRWNGAGGIGILHKSAKETINSLKKLNFV